MIFLLRVNILFITLFLLLFSNCDTINIKSKTNSIEEGEQVFTSDSLKQINLDSITAKHTQDSLLATNNKVSFLFMGDFMQHDPQINAAKDSIGYYNNLPYTLSYNYNHYFEYTESLINSVDYAIANLEVTLAGKPYSGYPRFCAPDEYAIAIKNAGFDILTTANNHSNDKFQSGLERTIDILDSLKIIHLGTYKDINERDSTYPLIIEKNNIKIALLNYTYGTNGIKTTHPNIVNMINENLMMKDIENAKEIGVDKIIAIMHWGKEYLSYPDKYQKKWGEWLLSNGVDIVIGGHPHWVQPMELRKDTVNNNDKLIVWSLGNIVSNQRRRHTDGGSALQFTLSKEKNGNVKFENVGYHLHWVWKTKENGKIRYKILPISKIEDSESLLPDKDKINFLRFINDERTLYREKNLNVEEFQHDPKKDTYYLEKKID